MDVLVYNPVFLSFQKEGSSIFPMLDILAISSTFGVLGLARLSCVNSGGVGDDYFTSMSSWFGPTGRALFIFAISEFRQGYPQSAPPMLVQADFYSGTVRMAA